jgi:hypothetical protein
MKHIRHVLAAATLAAAFSGTAWAETVQVLPTYAQSYSEGWVGEIDGGPGFWGNWISAKDSYSPLNYGNSLYITGPFLYQYADGIYCFGKGFFGDLDPWVGDSKSGYYRYSLHEDGSISYANYQTDNADEGDFSALNYVSWYSDGVRNENYTRSYVDADGKYVSDNLSWDTEVVRAYVDDKISLVYSGYGIFDFQNTRINYEDGTSVALSEVLAAGAPGTNAYLYGTVSINWSSTSQIASISLTYDPIAVPEPEACAMLLAGLGLVGVAARRQRKLGCR